MPWNITAARSLLSIALQTISTIIYVYNGNTLTAEAIGGIMNRLLPIPAVAPPPYQAPNVQMLAPRPANRIVGHFPEGDAIRQYDLDAPADAPYYAVRVGRNPGIYRSWITSGNQTNGHPNNVHQRFARLADATLFLEQ